MNTAWIFLGALLAATAVALGAFGAHGLKARVGPEQLAAFETGVRYHLYHALALILVGGAATRWATGWLPIAGWLFLIGIIVFSGTLYLLALTGARWLGAITPIGGLCFILGWLAFAIAALRPRWV